MSKFNRFDVTDTTVNIETLLCTGRIVCSSIHGKNTTVYYIFCRAPLGPPKLNSYPPYQKCCLQFFFFPFDSSSFFRFSLSLSLLFDFSLRIFLFISWNFDLFQRVALLKDEHGQERASERASKQERMEGAKVNFLSVKNKLSSAKCVCTVAKGPELCLHWIALLFQMIFEYLRLYVDGIIIDKTVYVCVYICEC